MRTYPSNPPVFAGIPSNAPPACFGYVAIDVVRIVEQILDVPQRERKPNVEHHSQADDLGVGLKVLERGAFCHERRLVSRPARLKPVSSDSAGQSPLLRRFSRQLPDEFLSSLSASNVLVSLPYSTTDAGEPEVPKGRAEDTRDAFVWLAKRGMSSSLSEK